MEFVKKLASLLILTAFLLPLTTCQKATILEAEFETGISDTFSAWDVLEYEDTDTWVLPVAYSWPLLFTFISARGHKALKLSVSIVELCLGGASIYLVWYVGNYATPGFGLFVVLVGLASYLLMVCAQFGIFIIEEG